MAPETAVIFLTAYGTVTEAVQAIKEGACDYLMKPVSFDASGSRREGPGHCGASAEHEMQPASEARKLVGRSPAFRRFLEQARQVARTDADVLIEAESGTGKELVARLIHRESARATGRSSP